jgi:hypothetical protein
VTRDHGRSCLMPWWNIQETVTKRGQFMRWLWRFFGFYLSPGVVTRYVKDCQSRFKISNARKMGTWKTVANTYWTYRNIPILVSHAALSIKLIKQLWILGWE